MMKGNKKTRTKNISRKLIKERKENTKQKTDRHAKT